MGIVAVVISSLVCISLFLLSRWWVEKKKYTGLSKGTTLEGRVIEPGALMKSGAYSYMFFITIIVVLIPAVLGLAAFSRRWVFEPFPTYWTLDNFRMIFLETPALIYNSFLFSGVALLFGIAFGLPAAYLIVRTQVPGKDALDFVITLMLAFPGIAVGVRHPFGHALDHHAAVPVCTAAPVLFADGPFLLPAVGCFARGGLRSIGRG
jgi:iron(III) transport system permease protein